MLRLASTLLVAVLLGAACERPLVVRADPTGTTKQPLVGDIDVRGETARALRIGERLVPKGTRVVIEETWLLRKRGGGFRVAGRYDPAVRTDGLMLERGAVDVVFLAAALPDRRSRFPVPQEAFAADPPR